MENSITRIVDLPAVEQSYSATIPTSNSSTVSNGLPTNYIPINTHPNPYGNSAQNPIPPTPQTQYINEEQQRQLQQMQPQRLPSRDIVHDTTQFTQDEQVQADYLPKPKQPVDYVRNHEDMTEHNLREYEKKNRHRNRVDDLVNEFQTPVFIIVLFFFFQLPMVNTMIFKRLSFFKLHDDDGNFNFYGLFLKSIMFGSIYYSVCKTTTYLSEL